LAWIDVETIPHCKDCFQNKLFMLFACCLDDFTHVSTLETKMKVFAIIAMSQKNAHISKIAILSIAEQFLARFLIDFINSAPSM
jgi:hypothetical protein